MSRRKPRLEPITREFLETVVSIMGPFSAAAQTLKAADEYDGEVRYWLDRAHDSYVLERVAAGSEGAKATKAEGGDR